MRDDLLDAQAAVDWAEAQFPAFRGRLDSWLRDNIDVLVEDLPPPATHNPIVAVEKSALPLAFNVEMGAYINTIRSGLDILATSLAHRYKIPRPDSAYFPVARSEDAFRRGDYKGHDFVKGLPDLQRRFIEALKPYDGGNKALWALHQLDIIRKHRRLVGVEMRPLRLSMAGRESLPPDFIPVHTATGWLRVNEKTVLGLIRKGADHEMKFIPHIAINEAGFVERKPIIATLYLFANLVTNIIKIFDET